MTRTHASGPPSDNDSFARGWRNRNADIRRTAPASARCAVTAIPRLPVMRGSPGARAPGPPTRSRFCSLAADLGPGLGPLRVVDADRASIVAAVDLRGLPQVKRVQELDVAAVAVPERVHQRVIAFARVRVVEERPDRIARG